MVHFTVEQRYKLEVLLQQNVCKEQIAIELRKHISSIYREIKRNSDERNTVYKANLASRKCEKSETIYKYLWEDKKKGGDLYKHLRTLGKTYRKRGASKDKKGQIIGRIGIENRPIEVDQKQRFGDLEIDLVIGKDHKGALLKMIEQLEFYK